MSEHDELESSIAAWVLGASDPDEAERIRKHVTTCAACSETVARLSRTAGALALDADEVVPPPGLRDRILVAARAGAQPSEARVIQLPVKARSRPPRPLGRVGLYASAAAAVIIALLAGVVVGDVVGHNTSPPSQVARFSLTGHGPLQGATASVVDLHADGIALVSFSGLPQPPAGMVYELWLITPANRADPAGVFVPDATGSKIVVVGHSLGGYGVMAVTVEVGPNGVSAPSQQPQLYGSIA